MASKQLSTLLVAVTVLLAGCTGAAMTPASSPDSHSGATTNTVTAPGSATVTAAPDIAVISVSVAATADTAEAARSQVAEAAQQLQTALENAGYEVNTTSYRLFPEYDYSKDRRELVGYRAVQVFEFETQPDAAGEAVDLAINNGATSVNYIRFALTDEHRKELRQQALKAAVNDARSDAEAVAAAANRSVGSVLSIQIGSTGGVIPYEARLAAASADAAGTSFDPGPVTVTATVTVTYELE